MGNLTKARKRAKKAIHEAKNDVKEAEQQVKNDTKKSAQEVVKAIKEAEKQANKFVKEAEQQVKNAVKEKTEPAKILKKAQQQKIKNLAFFKTFHPGIYNRFAEYVLDQYKVSLNTEINQLDILLNGKSIYNNRPIAEAKESLYEFDSNFAPGKVINTINPPFAGYDFPRFFHKKCADLVTKSPLKSSNYKGYTIPDFYPLIIFNGVGTGYHLEIFLESRKVINSLVVEPSPELFACSLYLIDWEKICQPFVDDPDKNIHFIVGPIDSEDHLHGYIMRYLGSHCPIYPLTSLFINHKPLDLYKRVTKKINEDTNVFVSVWGFYDDEVNQIN
ncbi:MAG: hypothetical protein RPR97_17990, partial [Colwellia sp.]